MDKEQCLAHTGLTPEMFGFLLPTFEIEYRLNAEAMYKKEHGKERERAWGGGRSGKLDTMEKKLFFVLYYLKTYQTYATLGGAFDMKKPRAYERINNTLPALLTSLKKTPWYLQPQQKNWVNSCHNIQKSKKSGLIELRDQYKEALATKVKKKITQVKRKNTH